MKTCWLLRHGDADPGRLSAALGPDDDVLAVDANALAWAARRFPRVRSVEDYVPYDEIMRLAERAHAANLELSRAACAGERLAGIDWPAFCWYARQWWLRDVFLMSAVSSALEARGFERLVRTAAWETQSMVYTPTWPPVWGALQARWGEKAQTQERSAPAPASHPFLYLRNRLEWLWHRLLPPRPELSRCDAVALFSESEWSRNTDLLEELREKFGDRFQVWAFGARLPEALSEWCAARNVRAVGIPYPGAVDPSIRAFFHSHWDRWRSAERAGWSTRAGVPELASEPFEPALRFQFLELWPRLAQWAAAFEGYLGAAQPRWLIGTSIYQSENTFPFLVGERAGIRSVAIPHTYVQFGNGTVAASRLACRNAFEREHFRNSFPDDARVVYARNAGNALSYSARATGSAAGTAGGRRVLVLTGTVDCGGVMALGDRKAALETLEALRRPPEEFSALRFVIRSHPRGGVQEALRELGPLADNVACSDPSEPVTEALASSWVIVVSNHYGSVVVPAVRERKPILFLDSARHFWPDSPKLAFDAGPVVRSPAELWTLLRRLAAEPAFYAELSERAVRYDERFMTPAPLTLGAQLEPAAAGASR